MMTSNQSVRRGLVPRGLVLRGLAVMMLALGGAMSGGAARANEQAAYDPWIGVWTVFEDGNAKCTLTIKQSSRDLLSASYTPGNGQAGIRVYDDVLQMRWRQDGDLKGAAQLKLSEDGKSFSGTSRTDGQTGERTWNGVKVLLTFTGVWQGAFGNTNLKLTLQQTGYEVTGTGESVGVEYNKVVTTLYRIYDGKVTDKKLSFKVVGLNKAVSSVDELTIKDDGKTIYGTFCRMNAGFGYVGPVPVEGGSGGDPRRAESSSSPATFTCQRQDAALRHDS